MSDARRALLRTMLSEAGLASTPDQPIRPRQADGVVPVSLTQQRIWFLDQLAPARSVYNVSLALELQGRLDITALEESLIAIARRHEALRTTFASANGQPYQQIHPDVALRLTVADLRDLSDDRRRSEILVQARAEAEDPFDLASGPLFRATLLRSADEEHLLVLVFHHIIADGWSLGIFARELMAHYAAHITGQPSQLPPLPIQYADFAVWQRDWLQGETLERQITYWKQRLENLPAILELPVDHARPAVQTFRGATQPFRVSAALTQALTALGQRAGASLYMTLLAAFQTLLHRYTHQDDVVIGSPIANRPRVELEQMIGFFANTLVMRADFAGNPTFLEMLARVRDTTLGAGMHQDIPFDQIVEIVQPERNLSYNPLFQVAFALQNMDLPAIAISGLRMTPMKVNNATAKFDLLLELWESDAGLQGGFEYNIDLFEPATIERMVAHLSTLLQGIVADPERHIADLPLLTVAERHQILVEWNATQTAFPAETPIGCLFEEQVKRSPDAVAAVFGDRTCTFRELDRASNQLAHYLRSLGVATETPVGISLDRSLDLIVAMLGVVKAGGVYVPLDAAYPTERIAYMIADARIHIVITQHSLRAHLPEQGIQFVCVDDEREEIAQSPSHPIESDLTATNLAYIIYTSGSTGRPKGVGIPHCAISRLVCDTDYVQLTPDDVVAHLSNTSFDAATFEIWGPLLTGARVAGFTKDVALSPHEFAGELRRHGVTTVFLTTALFNHIAREAPAAFQGVRQVLFGGEAVDPRWVRVIQHSGPDRLLHVYGPTETTTFASWHCVRDVRDDATTVPIGRPIANTQMFLVDSSLQPVPIGVTGELYIGGAGLARGYMDRPDLTAERFIPDPFSAVPGARLYRTGDIGRYLPDGSIEFVGRADQQVKIRGFRVEPGEVEAALAGHPAVRDVVVVAHTDGVGTQQLAAYVVPHPLTPSPSADGEGEKSSADETITPMALRRWLKRQLPDYMVPAAFVVMEHLPLNPNGKVDRQALPEPTGEQSEQEDLYVAPRSALEAVLARNWAGILGRERVGVEDNFFEVGGHSLLATRAVSWVRATFQIEVPLRTIFMAPTAANFAAALTALESTPGRCEAIARLRRQIDAMSPDEIRAQLASKTAVRSAEHG